METQIRRHHPFAVAHFSFVSFEQQSTSAIHHAIHSSQVQGASHLHFPPTIVAQNGTAGSFVAALTIGHAAGGQNAVVLSSPGQQG